MNDVLRVVNQINQGHILFWEVAKDAFKLFEIVLNKLAIEKTCALIEDVIVGLWIKYVVLLKCIFHFDFIFDHKAHEAEA